MTLDQIITMYAPRRNPLLWGTARIALKSLNFSINVAEQYCEYSAKHAQLQYEGACEAAAWLYKRRRLLKAHLAPRDKWLNSMGHALCALYCADVGAASVVGSRSESVYVRTDNDTTVIRLSDHFASDENWAGSTLIDVANALDRNYSVNGAIKALSRAARRDVLTDSMIAAVSTAMSNLTTANNECRRLSDLMDGSQWGTFNARTDPRGQPAIAAAADALFARVKQIADA